MTDRTPHPQNLTAQIPAPIKPLIDAYTRHLQTQFPTLIAGIYLHGSIALGAFNERFSDIDCITLVNRPCTDQEISQLGRIHQEVASAYPRWQLECSYLQRSDLGKFEDEVAPHPAFHDGRMNPQGYHDINSVTWWILKNRGIALIGPDPQSLDFTVDWDGLILRMVNNLNTYWRDYTRNPQRILWMYTDNGFQWAILGILRLFYTFKENDITSKTGAGEYGLKQTPVQWHGLVQDAINIREQKPERSYHSKLRRTIDVVRFLNYIIGACNDLTANNNGKQPIIDNNI